MPRAFLSGVRVLDLTNVLAGPFCCHQLAHMGADVIKVEVPGRGDLARQLGADQDLNRRGMGISFLAQNAGKRSVTLNLKHEQGKAIFRRLVATSDVVVENFRPGVMDKLGVGYESLRSCQPRLVYCAISGYGQDGPMRDMPAYDQIVQGFSGVMSITGGPETAPYRVGYPISDTIGGLTAAMAIAAALNGRTEDGGGAFIDVSMLDATLATMGWVVSNYLNAGIEPEPQGNENFTAAPSGTFETADGPINIAANKQEQFEALCRHIGRGDLIMNELFRGREDRKANRVLLKAELESVLTSRSAGEWVRELSAIGVPAGEVYSVPRALANPQVRSRELISEFPEVAGVGRDIRTVRTGFRVDGEPLGVDRPPPGLGAHTLEVLEELGLEDLDPKQLSADGVI
ncbi:MAG: hypothetical protein RLZ98_55 [Pseudomonadota bacterium]|jgi:formyl-CoA transferase